MDKIEKVVCCICLLILLISAFVPLYNYDVLNSLISFVSKIVFLLILFLVLWKHLFWSICSIGIVIFFIIILYSTKLNGFNTVHIYPILMKTWSIVLLYLYVKKKYGLYVLKMYSSIFSLFLILTFFQVLFFPGLLGTQDGNTLYLVATNYNQLGGFFLPVIVLNFLCFYLTKHGYVRTLLCLLMSLIVTIYCGSVTSSIGLLSFLMYFLFSKKLLFQRIMYKVVFLLTLCVFFAFVLPTYNIFNSDFIFSFLDKVGKDITFSGRTTIWEYTIVNILYSPIFGYGYYDRDWALSSLHGIMPHNIIFQLLIQGGMVLFIYAAVIIIANVLLVFKIQNRDLKYFFLISFSSYFLMLQFDVYSYVIMIFFLLIPLLSNDLIQEKKYV